MSTHPKHKPPSRQQKWAKDRKLKGVCCLCNEPLDTAWHCAKHAKDNKLATQKSAYNKKNKKNDFLVDVSKR